MLNVVMLSVVAPKYKYEKTDNFFVCAAFFDKTNIFQMKWKKKF